MQVRNGTVWSRPQTIEHRTLHGIDVWHAVLRAHPSTRISERGVLTISITTAAMRFIPLATYEAYFCAAEDCEESIADSEDRSGLCGHGAQAAASTRVSGNAASASVDTPADPRAPAARPLAAARPPDW
ncbi:hypothetical protein [Embleya sp. MST-111070]|uniref:hypothetical protein n=1 Tax=Embleya sp. MST-111070 TaxID=3398231 RepID=UPI003F735C12